MGTKYFCDRCNDYFIEKSDIVTATIPVVQQVSSPDEWSKKDFDLCRRCSYALEDFMKSLSKVKAK